MSEQKRTPEQLTRNYAPADEWRAHILLTKVAGKPVGERLRDIAVAIPDDNPSLPKAACWRLNNYMLIRMFLERDPGDQFLTRDKAVGKTAAFLYGALQASCNMDMKLARVFVQRSAVVEAYANDGKHKLDVDVLPAGYWIDVTDATLEEFTGLEEARIGLARLETTS